MIKTIEDQAIGLGGTISAQHSIGMRKPPNFVNVTDPVALNLMAKLSAALGNGRFNANVLRYTSYQDWLRYR